MRSQGLPRSGAGVARDHRWQLECWHHPRGRRERVRRSAAGGVEAPQRRRHDPRRKRPEVAALKGHAVRLPEELVRVQACPHGWLVGLRRGCRRRGAAGSDAEAGGRLWRVGQRRLRWGEGCGPRAAVVVAPGLQRFGWFCAGSRLAAWCLRECLRVLDRAG